MKIPAEFHQNKKTILAAMEIDRQPWWSTWRELADYFIPKRYVWLTTENEQRRYVGKNRNILDGTGTLAGRVLAAGMMDGKTSPSRPWLKLRIPGIDDDADIHVRRWLDDVEKIILRIMAESNFYNSLALMYIDLVFFGTAAMLIYEDEENVIRCYNCALGEFFLGQSATLQVNMFARTFTRQAHQVVEQWGLENCSETVREAVRTDDGRRHAQVKIVHLIEPNDGKLPQVGKQFKFRELYWEVSGELGNVLGARGYHEVPGVFPRWELTGNDNYGTCPALDALGDVIQLQIETKRKGQGLEYMVRPHMQADLSLQTRPSALMPGGQTFISGNSAGLKPAYEVRLPIAELTADMRELQFRIKQTFHNDLFRNISELQTVRSATEIMAITEQNLIQLGPVLERFDNEALDPSIKRIYNIAQRAGLLPEAPQSIRGADLEIQYVSALSTAQTAVGVTATERFFQVVGNLAPIVPDALELPDFMELLRDYARNIGVKAKGLRAPEDVQASIDAKRQQEAATQTLQQGQIAADTGKLLSETEVGGGANALQRIIGV